MQAKYAGLLTTRYRLLTLKETTSLDYYLYRVVFPCIARAIFYSQDEITIKHDLILGARHRLVELGYTLTFDDHPDKPHDVITRISWKDQCGAK